MKTSTWLLIGAGAYLLFKNQQPAAPQPPPQTIPQQGDGGLGAGGDPTYALQQYGQALLNGLPGIVNGVGAILS